MEELIEYQRLQAQIDRLEDTLPTAHNYGGLSHVGKVRRRIAALEADQSALHARLFPAMTAEEYENRETRLLCDECGDYKFEDRHARFRAAGLCPRCEGVPLDPNDPNLNLYDLEGGPKR
jgi:hypothetical protein